MSRDPLSPFDEEVIEAVAADRSRDPDALRALLRRHQEQMRELPGVENLVYEWRKTLPRDPLLDRREEAYLLVVGPHIWPQFAAALGMDEAALAAVRAVHARQLVDSVENDEDSTVDDGDIRACETDDRDAMIVTRE